jgi:hypothetical protein
VRTSCDCSTSAPSLPCSEPTRATAEPPGCGRSWTATNPAPPAHVSGLEERFLAICRTHGLPQPKVNDDLAGKERDFVFPDHRLVVEVDSWTYHRRRRAFETDRDRDQTLLVAGYRTLRVTDTQLELDPHGVGAALERP